MAPHTAVHEKNTSSLEKRDISPYWFDEAARHQPNLSQKKNKQKLEKNKIP
ncbi:MAG: hypothetical protein J6T46_05425 [Victivallales bacterium]|nr:hypothetical protein [Victivallales bacterium]